MELGEYAGGCGDGACILSVALDIFIIKTSYSGMELKEV